MAVFNALKTLTPKAKLFAKYYTESYKAVDAYKKSGYQGINEWAHKLLDDPIVQAEIERLEEETRERHNKVIDRNIAELSRIAYSSIEDTIDMTTGSPLLKKDADQKLIQDIEIGPKGQLKIKHHPRLQAIDMLNRMMGAYNDKVDVTSAGGQVGNTPTITYITTTAAAQSNSPVEAPVKKEPVETTVEVATAPVAKAPEIIVEKKEVKEIEIKEELSDLNISDILDDEVSEPGENENVTGETVHEER